jgi:nucleotide-binding universal stress UspA family protein
MSKSEEWRDLSSSTSADSLRRTQSHSAWQAIYPQRRLANNGRLDIGLMESCMLSPVLIAIDGSSASEGLLQLAQQFCQPDRHRLQVMLAIDSAFALSEPISLYEQQEFPAATDEQRHANHVVAQALQQLRAQGFACEGKLVQAEPVAAIVAQARQLDCALIIMGHRHLSRVGRLLDPSISSKVIDQVGCPVLVDSRQG